MDLLTQVKEEVASLFLTDQLEIAYYLYIRTGEIFEYDPLWEIGTSKEILAITNKKIDIHAVSDVKVICNSWAYLYHDLLQAFQIPSFVMAKGAHYKVVIKIQEKQYVADLTKKFMDISMIKFGMPIQYFCPFEKEEEYKILENKIHYHKGIEMQEVLQKLRKEIIELSAKNKINYLFYVCEAIKMLMNVPRKNVEYISGRTFIEYLFSYFYFHKVPYSTQFFNKEKTDFVDVYTIIIDENIYYFIYQKNATGFYIFYETDVDRICSLLDQYTSIGEENLRLFRWK